MKYKKPKSRNIHPFDVWDRIFLINLPSRTDRLLDSMYEFEKIGIKHRVEVIKTTTGHQGYMKAMFEILCKLKDENILIFEDDVQFVNNPLKTFKEAWKQIEHEDWHILYLGGVARTRLFKKYENWYRCKYTYCLHAVGFNKSIIHTLRTLLHSYLNKEAVVDRLLAERIQPYYLCYLSSPMIAVQRPGYSDLENKEIDYNMEQRFENTQKYGRHR